MSGISFTSEAENPGPVGPRVKPRKRRSSILKSPTRNALHDLDPNAADERETTCHAKKKRLSSRRVSFANTYQVQEYLTAQQLNIWEDNKTEREDTKPFSPEKSNAQLPSPSMSSSVNSTQNANISQSHQPDISVGPGHFIRGLETLLSGPIKKPSHSESEVFPKMLHCTSTAAGNNSETSHANLHPSEGAAQLPMIDEACEIPSERPLERSTNERSDCNDHPTDGPQDWPTLMGNSDNIGLIGPSYHCRLPMTDSFSSSCHASIGASSLDQSCFYDPLHLDHTSIFEFTRGRDHLLAGFANSDDTSVQNPQMDPAFTKKDASSFLKSFMKTDPDDVFDQPVHSTSQCQAPTLDSRDFLKSFMGSDTTQAVMQGGRNNNVDSPPKKRDAKSFLNSLFGNEQKQSSDENHHHPSIVTTTRGKETCIFDRNKAASEMDLTTCVTNKESEEGCKKKDASAFLKSLYMETDENQKMRVFNQDGATSEMEFTTCVSVAIKEACAVLHVSQQPDMTVRFGEDYTGNMEFTQCIGGQREQQDTSSQNSPGRSGRPLEDITRIFDGQLGGGEMDLTTCGNSFSADSSNNPRPDTRDGQTTVFHNDDTMAAMEMTTCLEGQSFSLKSLPNGSSKDSSLILHSDTRCENTRIFHHDDATAAMEMTTCLDGQESVMRSDQKSLKTDSSTYPQPNAGIDETRFFSPDDTTSVMDMTECLDEKTGIAKPATSISGTGIVQQEGSWAFSARDTDKMGATIAIDGISQEAKANQADERPEAFYGVPVDDPSRFDQTKIFKAEDTAGMELTACVGGVLFKSTLGIERAASKDLPTFQQEDCTRRFTSSDDTARMDLTTCVSGELAGVCMMTENKPSSGQGENTQIFASGDAADMELTTCLNTSLKPASSVSQSSKKALSTACLDQTNRMEMTACIGGIFPKMSVDSSETDHSPQPGDHTKVFSAEDTAGMEMTKCISGLDLCSVAARTQSDTMHGETRIFTSEDTAEMEMTTCIGGLLSKTSQNTIEVSVSEHQGRGMEPDHLPKMALRSSPRESYSATITTTQNLQDQTHIFTSESTACMDITTCVGGINGKTIAQSSDFHSSESVFGNVGISPTSCTPPPDQTRLFTHDNTGKMELTTCIGGTEGSDLKHSSHEKSTHVSIVERCCDSKMHVCPPSDSTRLFTHDETSKMELTKCIGGIDGKAMELPSNAQSTVESSPAEVDQSLFFGRFPSEPTHLFTDSDMGQMELTKCVGGVPDLQINQSREIHATVSQGEISDNKSMVSTLEKTYSQVSQSVQIVPREQGYSDQTRVFTSDDTAEMEITSCIDQSRAPGGSLDITDGFKQGTSTQESAALPNLSLTNSNKPATQEDHPTKRNSDTFTIEPSSGKGAAEPPSRRSDTFTLDKAPDASTTVDYPNAATISQGADTITSHQGSSEDEGRDMVGELNHWGSLDSADGIEDEQPMWVENTEDFAQLSAEAGVASMMMMQARKDHTVSKTSHEFPTRDVTNASQMANANQQENKDDKKEGEEEIASSSDSNLHSDNHLSTTPPSEPVSMQDFLSIVTINMKKGRRSVLLSIPLVSSAQTLSDLMEDHFLVKPKKEMYEWAVNHLSTSIEKMQDAVNEQEQRMSENNPKIVREVQSASPEQAVKLHEHIKSLHKACSKMSQSSFREWRRKMVGKTHQSLKDLEMEMNDIFTIMSTSSDTLDKALEELDKYEEGLDKALIRLKQVQPPCEEQVREFINNRNLLAKRQAEIEEMQKTEASLESVSLRLRKEMEQSQKELADVTEQEMLVCNDTTSQGDLQEALIKLEGLHCLQEWRLRKQSDEELMFTFLQDSLVFTITLGKEMDTAEGNGMTHTEISSLHMQRSLAADSEVCAHLAHNLIQASIDVPLLHKRHPTTATLKMLLQDVSEVVGQADGIADEIDQISYRHFITLSGTNPTIEFSNLDAMVKFWVTFNLLPGRYPFSVISADFKNKIGTLREQDIKAVVGNVKPGWSYISRLVQSIDALIEQHIPGSPTKFASLS